MAHGSTERGRDPGAPSSPPRRPRGPGRAASLNIPTLTPAPDHLLGGHEGTWGTAHAECASVQKASGNKQFEDQHSMTADKKGFKQYETP